MTPAYQITPIRAFSDNYIWVIESFAQRNCWVVDPGDASPVLKYLSSQGLELAGILITHHHYDHINGIPALIEHSPNLRIIAPSHPSIKGTTELATEGSEHCILDDLQFRCIAVPGHTLDHVAYFGSCPHLQDQATPTHPVLFCGDTLFSSGCGRLFEGSPAQMNQSLHRLAQLPAETLVFCTHEYTQANLAFSLSILPHDKHLNERAQEVSKLRSMDKPSLPSCIGRELEINLFLRTQEPELVEALSHKSEKTIQPGLEAFATLRAFKDHF